jgi:hypothetical protein
MANAAKTRHSALSQVKRWVLGAERSGTTVRMSRTGALVVDADALHASEGYARQLGALKRLERSKKRK